MSAPIVSWPKASDNDAARFRAFQDFDVTAGEYSEAVAQDAWTRNPTVSASRFFELDSAHSDPNSPMISDKEANERFGLDGHLKFGSPIRESAAQVLYNLKLQELQRQEILGRGHGFWTRSSGVATGLGVSVIDPLNLASAFVPVVGEARFAQLLGRSELVFGRAAAESFLVRSAARATKGLIEGAAGATMVEPIILAQAKYEQADYDFGNSLENIIYGSVIGAGLHVSTGGVGDLLERVLLRDLHPETQRDMFKAALSDMIKGEEVHSPADIAKLDPQVIHDEVMRLPEVQQAARELGVALEKKDLSSLEMKWTPFLGKETAERGGFIDLMSEGKSVGEAEVFLKGFANAGEEVRAVLHAIAVKEELRGKGLGTQFLSQIEDWARSKGAQRMVVQSVSNPEFFKKQGYRRLTDQNTTMGKDLVKEASPINQARFKDLVMKKTHEVEMKKLDELHQQETAPREPARVEPRPEVEHAPQQERPGEPIDLERQVADKQADTDKFISDHLDKLSEKDQEALGKFDERFKETVKRQKGYLQAVACLLGRML